MSFQTTSVSPGRQVVERRGEAGALRGGLAGADLLGVEPSAPGAGQGVLLELGVLGVDAYAGQADDVALAAGEVEHGEGRGGGRGLCHIPNVLKPSHNF
jgi:hypothetical protein